MDKKGQTQQFALTMGVALVLIVAVGGLLFLAVNFLLSIEGPPDCAFPQGGGSCDIQVTLPQDREASLYAFDMSFQGIPENGFSIVKDAEQVATRRNHEDDRNGDTYMDWFLFKVPEDNYPEIAQVMMIADASGRVQCADEGEDSELRLASYVVTLPWGNSIPVGDDRATDRNPQNYLLEEDRDNDGDRYVSTHNLKIGQRVLYNSCHLSRSQDQRGEIEDYTKTSHTESVFDVPPVQENILTQRFMVEHEGSTEEGGDIYPVNPPSLKVAMKKALYPEDLTFQIGSGFSDTMQGRFTNDTVSLDFADQINEACGRDDTGAECVVDIRITSAEGGNMWIDADPTLKAWNPGSASGDGPGESEVSGSWWQKFIDWITGWFR